jgi:hypothetical protein
MIVVPLHHWAVGEMGRDQIAHVVHNMRAADAREVFAARFSDSRDQLVDDLYAGRPFCIGFLALCGDDGTAIALLGARLMTPVVADVLMIATDDWPKIALAATRFAIRVAIPCYLGPNAQRAECKAWEGNAVSRRWLEALGFEEEGTLRAYGAGMERFVQYGWVNPRAVSTAASGLASQGGEPLPCEAPKGLET